MTKYKARFSTKGLVCLLVTMVMVITTMPALHVSGQVSHVQGATAGALEAGVRETSRLDAHTLELGSLDVGSLESGSHVAGTIEALTVTLNTPIGMQGFEGAYALGNNPNQLVEIGVQFTTPPVAALQLMLEANNPYVRNMRISLEAYALAAHASFFNELKQLGGGVQAFGSHGAPLVEVLSQHHTLFNGVFLRVPAYMVDVIAGMDGVFSVSPNSDVIFIGETYDGWHDYTAAEALYADIMPLRTPTIDDIAPNARLLLEMDHIHNTMGITGSGVRVAVIDSGIDYNHPIFVPFQDPQTGSVRGDNFAEAHFHTPLHVAGASSHGTNVAGALVGFAPDIELWAYRIQNNHHFVLAMEAAFVADINVINLSIGFPHDIFGPFHPINGVVDLAVMSGIVVVAAAGNSGPEPFSVIYRGGLTLTVAAARLGCDSPHPVTSAWTRSARGPEEMTFFIGPDVVAPGFNVMTTFSGDTVGLQSGTSMASPVVAGIAALVLEAFPSAAPYEVKARIMSSAVPFPLLHYDSVFAFGAGRINPRAALENNAFATVNQITPSIGWITGALGQTELINAYIPSLNFGAVNQNTSRPMTISIHNPGAGTWRPSVWVNNHLFNQGQYHHSGIRVNLLSSNTTGQTHIFTYQVTINPNVPSGLYGGRIVFTNAMQPGRILTIPYGFYNNFSPRWTVSPGTNHVFPPMMVGYTTPPAAHEITFTTSPAFELWRRVFLVGENADSFEISSWFVQPSGGFANIYVQPKAGLPVGTHTATVVVMNEFRTPNDGPYFIDVRFDVVRYMDAIVDTWEGLRAAVNTAPVGVPTVIGISNCFDALPGIGSAIEIPGNRIIEIVSTNTDDGYENMRVLMQENANQRHFLVNPGGNLTLGTNIVLSGGHIPHNLAFSSGGVRVNHGTFTMIGSEIRNSRYLPLFPCTLSWYPCYCCLYRGGGAVQAIGSHFYMYNSTIISNITSFRGGGILLYNTVATIRYSEIAANHINNMGLPTFFLNNNLGNIGSNVFNLSTIRLHTSLSAPVNFLGGGGIYVGPGSFVDIYDSQINSNIVALTSPLRNLRGSGSALFINNNSNFFMHSGSIMFNHLMMMDGVGGSVFMYQNGLCCCHHLHQCCCMTNHLFGSDVIRMGNVPW